jgi:hypothetical protein
MSDDYVEPQSTGNTPFKSPAFGPSNAKASTVRKDSFDEGLWGDDIVQGGAAAIVSSVFFVQ